MRKEWHACDCCESFHEIFAAQSSEGRFQTARSLLFGSKDGCTTLIVLPENTFDLLLGLHDLVVEASGRDAHRAMTENDQLL